MSIAEIRDFDPQSADLEHFAATRDPRLRAQLIANNVALVERLARRFARRGEPYEDLVQSGTLGLIKALDRFDPARGVAFSSYATQTINGELKRHFRDRGWWIRPPRRIQELHLHLSLVSGELAQRLGRSPTVHELGLEVGASPEDVLEALEAVHVYRALSLDLPDERGGSLEDELGFADGALEGVELRALLDGPLAKLSPREQLVLRLRFEGSQTQNEIADVLGISQMQVSRTLSSAFAKLKRSLTERTIDGDPRRVRNDPPPKRTRRRRTAA